MLSNAGRYRDRNPDTRAAGKLFYQGESAKTALITPEMPRTPEVIYKFQCTTQPAPGRRRVFYGRYSDPGIESLLTHGINTKPSLVAGDLVNPSPLTSFAQRLSDTKARVYSSTQRAPLGRSHDQTKGLPNHVGQYKTTFGIKTFKDCTAGELVHPVKTREQVNQEDLVGREMYKKSHSAYEVGETYDRKYNWSVVPKTSCFGVETPHDNRGKNLGRSLKWLSETQRSKSAPIVSKRLDDYQEKAQSKLGQSHDPIKDTMNVPPGHTFGILFRPDEYGAGDLIHMRKPGSFLRGRERARGVIAAAREHLKKANYHNFDHLKAAFEYYDKNKSGKIDINELREMCNQFNVPIQTSLLEELLDYCDVDKDGLINYNEFAAFLNWKDKLPSGLEPIPSAGIVDKEGTNASPITESEERLRLTRQIDESVVDMKTSASIIGEYIDQLPRAASVRPNGVPTIRSDLPAPRIRRLGDTKNYGDESDAYGLINPSMFSTKGVYERDFFESRDKHDIRRIFDSIGVEMTSDRFEEVWEEARARNPGGDVSVQSFKEILEELANRESVMEDEEMRMPSTLPFITTNRPEIYNKVNELYNKSAPAKEVLTS